MNLPNFVNFAPFNQLRHRMRTDKFGTFDLNAARNRVPGFEPLKAKAVQAECEDDDASTAETDDGAGRS